MIGPAGLKPPTWARNRRKATVKNRQNPLRHFLSMIQFFLVNIENFYHIFNEAVYLSINLKFLNLKFCRQNQPITCQHFKLRHVIGSFQRQFELCVCVCVSRYLNMSLTAGSGVRRQDGSKVIGKIQFSRRFLKHEYGIKR